MNKFVVFVVISAVLVTGIYSSSIFFVSAALNTICTGTSPTTTTCVVQDGRKFTTWECKTKDGGKTWSCKQVKATTPGSIPGLTNALSKAMLAQVQEANTTGVNDTKVTERLNDLPVMNKESIDSDDNGD